MHQEIKIIIEKLRFYSQNKMIDLTYVKSLYVCVKDGVFSQTTNLMENFFNWLKTL